MAGIKTTAAYVMLAAMAVVVTVFVIHAISQTGPVAALAGPPADQRFVVIGRAYLPELGRAYAAAWEAGAKDLDAGKPISAAVGTVGSTWASGRTRLYDLTITSELTKIVPDGAADVDVTAEKRAAMAAAFRGLAQGLSQ